jgi:hypothetical protein
MKFFQISFSVKFGEFYRVKLYCNRKYSRMILIIFIFAKFSTKGKKLRGRLSVLGEAVEITALV